MGHYLSEIEGTPFKFSIKCTLHNYQKSKIRQNLFKNEKEKIHHITLSLETITTDPERVWAEIHYNPHSHGSFFVTKSMKKIEKILGDQFIKKARKKLEKTRQRLLD